MDTKVESDSNHIGHEHRSFRWSLLSNSYVRGNSWKAKRRSRGVFDEADNDWNVVPARKNAQRFHSCRLRLFFISSTI